jgi:hypothetical protein
MSFKPPNLTLNIESDASDQRPFGVSYHDAAPVPAFQNKLKLNLTDSTGPSGSIVYDTDSNSDSSDAAKHAENGAGKSSGGILGLMGIPPGTSESEAEK